MKDVFDDPKDVQVSGWGPLDKDPDIMICIDAMSLVISWEVYKEIRRQVRGIACAYIQTRNEQP